VSCEKEVKIKICGITNASDGRLACALGADLLGFNFYTSSLRYIEPGKAAQIIRELPPGPERVGLFVNAKFEYIKEVLTQCPLSMVQLHGDEDNAFCRKVAEFGLPILKALRMSCPEDIRKIEEFETEYILLDAFREDLYGGTGESFDWSWIRETGAKKIFLAGGINPDTIAEALAVGTYGIDLCSGVEKEPGIKDEHKMRELFDKIEHTCK
jgi:phosphoribosylanthranilate isomerase